MTILRGSQQPEFSSDNCIKLPPTNSTEQTQASSSSKRLNGFEKATSSPDFDKVGKDRKTVPMKMKIWRVIDHPVASLLLSLSKQYQDSPIYQPSYFAIRTIIQAS